MTTPATRSGSPRLAVPELPCTLTPNPISSAARGPNRAVSVLGSLALYLLCGGAVMAMPRLKTVSQPRIGTTGDTDLQRSEPQNVIGTLALNDPPKPAEPERAVRPPDWVKPDTSNIPPDDPVTTYPTTNQSLNGVYDESMPVAKPGETATPPEDLIKRLSKQPVSAPRTVSASSVIETTFDNLRVLSKGNVVYPPIARLAGIQGDVKVNVTIDGSGTPCDAQVISGPMQLHAEAVRSAMTWRFEPARMNGEPVKARFTLTLQFRLK